MAGLALQALIARMAQHLAQGIAKTPGAVARFNAGHAKPILAELSPHLAAPADSKPASRSRDLEPALDAGAYLEGICRSISRSKLDDMHIQLELVADRVPIEPDRCWRLGMIVCELVTNAARAVFRHGKGATIRINLSQTESWAVCEVDSGATRRRPMECLASSKIVEELARSLDGTIVHRYGRSRSSSKLHFVPLQRAVP